MILVKTTQGNIEILADNAGLTDLDDAGVSELVTFDQFKHAYQTQQAAYSLASDSELKEFLNIRRVA